MTFIFSCYHVTDSQASSPLGRVYIRTKYDIRVPVEKKCSCNKHSKWRACLGYASLYCYKKSFKIKFLFFCEWI